ncbi:FAD-linked oxidase C-terminal domain-containing protein [Campylobacter taeniopygiae]|uniref:Glycolate oxidase subunit GlcD n=1 Tax=Campylobacter taeniopygiae TaxID=2510188 RepID=A0ABY2TIG7_9BACT|nr:FAD-linked oxidase C-terminal domain-containing protein [Campylobacter taeniopygiae]TKX33917.1 glycolate oxidase subunit GlcD [Campylobacter taeniopygiae]
MKEEFKQYFIKLLGKENAYFDQMHKIAYSYDATKNHYLPDGVLFPRNEEDISDILKFCNNRDIIVVPRGAGTGMSGGSLAVNGGLILAFEKHMNKILEIDLDNLVAVVQPGVINMHLQKEIAKYGLFYPPDPASMEHSSLGGNVSENAGGMRATKYGITKDYVLALRAVLPNGEIISAGKRTIKDVAGYNLAGILIASEGSLAVFSELTLKLAALPKFKKTAMGIFPNVKSAMNAVFKTLASGVTPASMEFLDNLSICAVETKFNIGLPIKAGAILVVEVDGNIEASIDEDLKIIKHYFLEENASEFKIARDEKEAKDIWFARKNCSQSIAMYGKLKLNEDITVPRSKLPDLLEGIAEISKKYGFKIPCFGHAGDGNVHTNIMVEDKNDQEQVKKGYLAVEELFKLTIKLGGTLSGEHGIGISKASFMNLAFSNAEMNLMRNIKKAFDPNNILNPFKMGL